MRKPTLIICSILFAAAVHAQDYERVAPKTLKQSPEAGQVQAPSQPMGGDTRLVGKNLSGVVFVAHPQEVHKKGIKKMKGVEVKGLPLLDTPEFRARIQPYLGQPISLNFLNRLSHEVVAWYAEHDRPLVIATVPDQDITGGVVQIEVVEGELGQVRVTDNHWFRSSIFTSAVHIEPKQPISKKQLTENVRTLNQNPFHTVDTVFRPGHEPGSTDIWLQVKDRFPLRVYTGYENTGTKNTGEDRLIYGMNWGNAFGLDQQLNYQYTTSTDFNEYQAHSGSYVVPLPWGHRFTLFGVYDRTQAEVPANFGSNAHSFQLSGRYSIPLPDVHAYTHELNFGYDFKSTNNNLSFGGNQVFNTTVEISQFVIEYGGSLPDPYGTTSLDANLFLSPGNMTDHNTTQDFNAGTQGSKADYVYAHVTIQRVTPLPRQFSLYSKFTFQLASGTLFSTETLGAGGFDSVRGYSEREANGDEGIVMTQEVRSPEMHLTRRMNIPLEDSLQFLAFWDMGVVTLKNPGAGQKTSYTLSSLGVGLRYSINPYLTLRADYGWQLTDTGMNDGFDSRASIGATLSY